VIGLDGAVKTLFQDAETDAERGAIAAVVVDGELHGNPMGEAETANHERGRAGATDRSFAWSASSVTAVIAFLQLAKRATHGFARGAVATHEFGLGRQPGVSRQLPVRDVFTQCFRNGEVPTGLRGLDQRPTSTHGADAHNLRAPRA
jgi:hypothetical protein